jgi:hypothetical protein
MRFIPMAILSAMLCGTACAAEEADRAAVISRIETQYATAAVIGKDSPMVEMMVANARSQNPNTDEATWTAIRAEVAAALTSMITAKDGVLDQLLSKALEPLSTPDLKQLADLLKNPVYVKFQAVVNSAENQTRMMQVLAAQMPAFVGGLNDVLQKHGLKPSN